jgi:hypothetical protein
MNEEDIFLQVALFCQQLEMLEYELACL